MATCKTCLGKGNLKCPQCGGSGKKVRLTGDIQCPNCHGSGKVMCGVCHGKGTVY